jgi:glycosyltransferase involved in cell wall biosynthesis
VGAAVLPGVSVVIPTLNSAKYLAECLQSVREQDYPDELLEVILVDGGSDDETHEIAHRYRVEHILHNRLMTGEAGKAQGIHHSDRELILMIDSDNVLVGSDWLRRMVQPLVDDPTVVSSECLRWDYRRQDHYINRYQALTGINDPMSLFIGNFDRWSELQQRWTGYPVTTEHRDGWERVTLTAGAVPTMGANGYLVRRSAYEQLQLGDYLFDIDAVHDLVAAGLNTIARVDVPIRHYFCDSVSRFYRKTLRRTDDYFFFRSQGMRTYPWTTRQRLAVLRFVVSTVFVLPLLAQVYRGYRRVPDAAWLFHVPACVITLLVYATGTMRSIRRPAQLDRAGWSQ